MDRRDLLPYHKAFRDLIDKPEVFDLVVDIMGPYILFSMSQAIVRASTDTFPGYTHTDGGEGLRRIRVSRDQPSARYESDVSVERCGRTRSRKLYGLSRQPSTPLPEDNSELTPHTPGAVQLEGKARGLLSVQSFALAWPRA